jgi:hypothetical protein
VANTETPWEDTHLTIHAGERVILGISYLYSTGTWAESNAGVAPDRANATPPPFSFISTGISSGRSLVPASAGLSAKLGTELPFSCGFGTLARSTQQAPQAPEDLYLGLHLPNRDDVESVLVHVAMIQLGSSGGSFIYV